MYLRKISWIKHLDFIVIDLICIICAMILPFMLRYRKLVNIFANNEYRTLLVTAIILHFCITFFSNCYSDIMSRGYFNEFKTVLIHNLKLIALVFTYLFATQLSETYSRLILGAFFCVNVILMYLAHTLLKYVQSRTKRAEARKQHILIYAAPDVAETSLTKVMEGIDKSFQVTGIALTEKQSQITDILGVPVVAYGDEVYEYACRNVVDSIACPMVCPKFKILRQPISSGSCTTTFSFIAILACNKPVLPNVSINCS